MLGYLNKIERKIGAEENWTKEAMNMALISIGGKNKKLNREAVASARRIGKVEVTYGATSCKLPDAIAYLTHDRLQQKLK